MKIYIYTETCTMKGRVCQDEELIESGSDDIFMWGEGTKEQLIAEALRDLEKPTLRLYDVRCARNVLDYLGGPQVEYDEEAGAFRPIVADHGE